MLCLFWLLAYYVLLSFGKALGDKGSLHPILALWLPNLTVGCIALVFFRKAMRESPSGFVPRRIPRFRQRNASTGEQDMRRPRN